MPLHRGQLLRAGHRAPARRLGQPRPERRRDHRPRARTCSRSPILLHTDVATVHKVLDAWGPGKFDAELFLDGKAFQPNGTSGGDADPAGVRAGRASTCTPGPAGARSRTGTRSSRCWRCTARAPSSTRGWTTPRSSRSRPRTASATSRAKVDLVSPKLPALQAYQLVAAGAEAAEGLVRPGGRRPRQGAVQRPGRVLDLPRAADLHRARLRTCTPGSQIGIDNFEADRSPTHMYRTSPLAGLWTHQKGGFYHDGRFPDLLAVVKHYDSTFHLGPDGQAEERPRAVPAVPVVSTVS